MAKKKKQLPDYTNKKWNSLGDLMEKIKKDGVEEIIDFNGYRLTTQYRKFGLAFGELTTYE